MDTIKSKDSLCEACGVEVLTSGNYKIRVIPAKKMPKKAIKLYRNPLKVEKNPWGQSRFQKYLLARSKPKNIIEITCGNCSVKTEIRMNKPRLMKPVPKTPRSGNSAPCTESSSSKKRTKRTKTPKDLNAGLIIPPSMLVTSASPSTPLTSSLKTTPSKNSSSGGSGGLTQINNPLKRKAAAQAEKKSKQKGMDNLKRVLYKSKQLGSNSSMNLQNFLGSSP